MKLSHVIFYVKNLPKQLAFYEMAFGIKEKFVHESGMYAELDTGECALAFVDEELGKSNLPDGFIPLDAKKAPQACEIVFTVPDVEKAYQKAVKAGAKAVAKPEVKPWGQTVAYVRDPEGILIELGSVIEGTAATLD